MCWSCLGSAARTDRLRGRKLTMREPELVCGSSMATRGASLFATEADAARELDAALDTHERPVSAGASVDYARALSGLLWLDSIVVMLTLGTMSIVANASAVTATAIATAFVLAPRRAGDGASAETLLEERPTPDAQPAAGSALPPPCSVLPGAHAHWVALASDGLPARTMVGLVRALERVVVRRVAHLKSVLDRHAVPLAHRDGSNLVSGLAGVRPPTMPPGKLTHVRRAPETGAWKVPALVVTAQSLLPPSVPDVPGLVNELLQVGRPEPPVAAQMIANASGPVPVAPVHTFSPDVHLHLRATSALLPAQPTLEGAIDGAALASSQAASAPAPFAELSCGDLLRELDAWLDWREDGAHKSNRAQYRREVPQHEWTPRLLDVREFLNFCSANENMSLVDDVAAVLTDGVLNVYIDWTCDPSGRLRDLCGDYTDASLSDAKSASYRLPDEVVIVALWHVLTHLRQVDNLATIAANGARYHFVDPGGHVQRSAHTLPSAKMLKKAKSALNLYGASLFGLREAVVSSNEVASAYDLSLRELNREARRCTPPLYRAVVAALVESIDVSSHRGVRLVLWAKLATTLMTRTYEGASMLHADLELDANNLALGEWLVGAYTKTADGIAGRVPGWDLVNVLCVNTQTLTFLHSRLLPRQVCATRPHHTHTQGSSFADRSPVTVTHGAVHSHSWDGYSQWVACSLSLTYFGPAMMA